VRCLASDNTDRARDIMTASAKSSSSGSAAVQIAPSNISARNKTLKESISRWIDIQTATLGIEYRSISNSNEVRTTSQMRVRDTLKGRFKFDAKGNFTIVAAVSTGPSFITSWDTTGVGTGSTITNHYLKQLYFAAKPVKGLEVQYGSLDVARGESTDITSYDTNGYIVGQRIILRQPQRLFFDEVSATYAYIGDYSTPNTFRRLHRLGQSNYHQILLAKKLNSRLKFSGDYTFQGGVDMLREAFWLKIPELRTIDSLRFENYQRVDITPTYGFAVSGEKTLLKKLSLSGGYADIDPHFIAWNAARILKGKRLFSQAVYNHPSGFGLCLLYTNALGNNFTIPNHRYMEVILSYNVLKSFQRAGWFK